MKQQNLQNGADTFLTSVVEAAMPRRTVLFAAGAGGNPERHAGLLEALAADCGTIIAPHFDRLKSNYPTEEELMTRARRMVAAIDALADSNLPLVGEGHSIGGTLLLALAGGRMWLSRSQPLTMEPVARLARLVVLAPPTGFYGAPGALDGMHVPVMAWAGTEDAIKPTDQAKFFRDALGNRVPLDLRVAEGAGHYSFMNVPPPGTTEPLADRDAFLEHLAGEIRRYVACVGTS